MGGKVPQWACAWAAALSVWAHGPACASPWPRPPGETFIETRGEYFRTAVPDGVYRRLDSQIYVEHGAGERVLIGGKAIYGDSRLSAGAAAPGDDGFTELEAFVQYTALRRGRTVVSVRGAVIRPAEAAAGARPELVADGVDIDLRALVGRSLDAGAIKAFAALEGGYRKRTGLGADQFRADATIGVEPFADWLVMVEALSTVSLGGGDRGPDFDVVRIQPSLVWRVTSSLSLRAGAGFETAARNIAPGRSVFIGLWSTF